MVNDLHDAERNKRDPRRNSSKVNSKKTQKNSVNENPEFMPQTSDSKEPSSSCQFQLTEVEKVNALPSTYRLNTKVPTTNSLDENHITSSFLTQHSDPTPQTNIKTTLHP